MKRAAPGSLARVAVIGSVLALGLVFADGYLFGAPLAIAALCLAAVTFRQAPVAASAAMALSVVALIGPVVYSAFTGR